jgi:hypothetical protein
MHATIELRMLLLIARQQSERPFSMESVPRPLLGNRSVNTPNLNNRETVFRGARAEELSWRLSALTLSVSKPMRRHSDQLAGSSQRVSTENISECE